MPAPSTLKRLQMAMPWIPALLGLLVYLPALTHGWLEWDDGWLVRDNPLLHNWSWNSLVAIWTDLGLETRLRLGAEYLPVRDTSVLLDWQLWGNTPIGSIAVNLLLYTTALALLFRLYLRILPTREAAPWIAGGATLLFALHPIHVESVVWIAARKDLLSLLFFVAAALSFERYRDSGKRRDALAVTLFYILAVLSKYAAIVLPAWLLLRSLPWNRRTLLLLVTPITAATTVLFIIILKVSHTVGMTGYGLVDGVAANTLLTADLLRRYAIQLLLPLQLSPTYLVEPLALWSKQALPAWIFLISGTTFIVLLVRRKILVGASVTLFCALWLVVALMPVSSFVGLQNKMADRYLLLPSIGFTYLTAFWLLQIRPWRQAIALLLTIAVCYAILASRQIGYWKSDLTLWEHAVEVEPRSPQALFKLSQAYKESGQIALERDALEALLQLDPQHEKALNNLAINLYKNGGDPAGLLPLYLKLLSLNPKNIKALNNYGYLLIESGKSTAALAPLLKAVQLQPGYCAALNNLGRAHLKLGESAAARQRFDEATRCDPQNRLYRDNLNLLMNR